MSRRCNASATSPSSHVHRPAVGKAVDTAVGVAVSVALAGRWRGCQRGLGGPLAWPSAWPWRALIDGRPCYRRALLARLLGGWF